MRTDTMLRHAAFFTLAIACSGTDDAPSAPGNFAGAGAGTSGSPGAAGAGGASAQGGSQQTAGTAGSAVSGGGAGGAAQAGSGGQAAGSGGAAGGGGGVSGGGSGGGGGATVGPDVAFCGTALDAAAVQLTGFRNAYTVAASVPRSAKNGNVSLVNMLDWTSGFVGGSYWILYEHTQEQAWRTAAEARTAAMESQKSTTSHHDLGFQFMSTYGRGHQLTQSTAYFEVLKTAASSLRQRYRQNVGAIESWDNAQWDCPVIVDNMMNLKFWYYVGKNGGDASLIPLATQHADTTLENHFRPDGSSYHLVNYNTGNGNVISRVTVQGYANDSDWARGQSWGLYGFTEVYGETKEARFLAQAQKIADYLIAHPKLPEDKVPYWDYDAPTQNGNPPPRDSSAAAIMASALFELASYVTEPAATRYRDHAIAILKSLSSPAYAAATGQNSHFLLMHSVGHLPANSEIDVALNYADYYYLEALSRCDALATP